jgi:hypothetical protein
MNTNSANSISQLLDRFKPITLGEMDSVRLMRRVDTKFVVPITMLPALLESALSNYRMVEIGGRRDQPYETTYFDTNSYEMYRLHHNGKLNRFKIRLRSYKISGQDFLEVKRKNNRGETIKTRIAQNGEGTSLGGKSNSVFLSKYTPYNHSQLQAVLGNSFIRLTLVSKQLDERITIDYNLSFSDLKHENQLLAKGLCIVEIKRSRDSSPSPFIATLTNLRVNAMGFSKYCLGMAMLNPEVKNNLFRNRIRLVNKYESEII